MSYWKYQGRQKRMDLNNPEFVVDELMRLEGITRYQIAKESGLSWPTIAKAARYGSSGYSRKTKARLKLLVQPIP